MFEWKKEILWIAELTSLIFQAPEQHIAAYSFLFSYSFNITPKLASSPYCVWAIRMLSQLLNRVNQPALHESVCHSNKIHPFEICYQVFSCWATVEPHQAHHILSPSRQICVKSIFQGHKDGLPISITEL